MNPPSFLHFAWLLPLAVLALYIGSPRFLGTIGSARVRRVLNASLDKNQYTALHDLLLPSGGGTVHLDHLVLSRKGICVIDSIHRPGWISGTEVQARWQQKHLGRTWVFDNPIHTNYLKIQALEHLLQLPGSRFTGMVVWSGHSGFRKDIPRGIAEVSGLVSRIRALNRELLTGAEVDAALLRLQESRILPGFMHRVQRWKMLRLLLIVALLVTAIAIYAEPLRHLISRVQAAVDSRMAPENFRPDGQPKTSRELWEDSLRCAWSPDLGRCSCYEPGGRKAELSPERCRELAERGSILNQ